MWKIAIGFVVFAAVSLFVLMQAGDKVEMGARSTAGMCSTRRPSKRRTDEAWRFNRHQ